MVKLKAKSIKRKAKVKNLKFLVLSFSFTLFALRFSLAFAQPVSSTELIENAKQYDGQTINYRGEVIGEVMRRGNFSWINVFDGANAIGIWISSSLAKDIAYAGSYKSAGDKIEVMGTFHRACAEHGGDMDIHAITMQKVASGRPIQEKLNPQKRDYALILLATIGVLWILSRSKRK